MTGYINSFQSLGAVDGPGVRVVVFMQGCNIRCKYCHNPETWERNKGDSYTEQEVFKKILRYKNYFKNGGGVTFSGGEPLLQSEFLVKLIRLLKAEKIHVALDTNGSIIDKNTVKLLTLTDLVLLDIKMTENELYEEYAGMSFNQVIKFLNVLEDLQKDVWVRQIILEGVNDHKTNLNKLQELKNQFHCIKKIELLPFKKICMEKYEKLGIAFPLKDLKETEKNKVDIKFY